jgi:hypothetical protein
MVDYLFVQSGQDQNSVWYSSWLAFPVYGLAPLGFYWACFAPFQGRPNPWRYLYPAMVAIPLSGVWFMVAISIVVNFHFALGGSI